MKKTKAKRKLIRRTNAAVRNMNKMLQKDVFGDRFHFTIIERYVYPYSDNSGYDAWMKVSFEDRKCPERNVCHWYDSYKLVSNSFFGRRNFQGDVNDFIVTSDFWENKNA